MDCSSTRFNGSRHRLRHGYLISLGARFSKVSPCFRPRICFATLVLSGHRNHPPSRYTTHSLHCRHSSIIRKAHAARNPSPFTLITSSSSEGKGLEMPSRLTLVEVVMQACQSPRYQRSPAVAVVRHQQRYNSPERITWRPSSTSVPDNKTARRPS